MMRIIVALMLHEMATTYGKSAGGYVWAVLAPVLGAALLSVIFSLALLAVGMGTLNCYLVTAFPVWERIWHILMRPLFLMSGIFLTFAMMPTQAQNFLWFNPLIHCGGLMRCAKASIRPIRAAISAGAMSFASLSPCC